MPCSACALVSALNKRGFDSGVRDGGLARDAKEAVEGVSKKGASARSAGAPAQKMTMKTAQFIEGYRAREEGKFKSENPYLGTNKGRSIYEWNSGWSEADAAIWCRKYGLDFRRQRKGRKA